MLSSTSLRAVQHQPETALGDRLLGQQHAPHVGVLDDRHRRRERVLVARQPALRAVLRVAQRVLVGGQVERARAAAHRDPGLVHHVEHLAHAVVRHADEIADARAALAEVQHGVDHAALAELVVEPGHVHVVARGGRAVVADQELRHDEERDALHAGRCVRQAREHEVDDVLGQVVLGGRDPHLRAADAVGAVAMRNRLRLDVGQRRAGLRLAQRHRAEVTALDHRRHPARALLLAAEVRQQVGRADRQPGIGVGRVVGRREDEPDRRAQRRGQLQAAAVGGEVHGQETGLDERPQRDLEALRRHHAALVQPEVVRVELRRAGREVLARHVVGGIEDRGQRGPVVVGEVRQVEQRVEPEDVEELKVELPAPRGDGGRGAGSEHRSHFALRARASGPQRVATSARMLHWRRW